MKLQKALVKLQRNKSNNGKINPSKLINKLNKLGVFTKSNCLDSLKELVKLETLRRNYPKDFAKGKWPETHCTLTKSMSEINTLCPNGHKGRCIFEMKDPDIKYISGFIPELLLVALNRDLDELMDAKGKVSSVSDDQQVELDDRDSKSLWVDHDKENSHHILKGLATKLQTEILNLGVLGSQGYAITHEEFQIVDYGVGQKYVSHSDEDNHLEDGATSRRVTTCLLYLKSPQDGGTTTFTDLGLTFAPKPGDLIVFTYLTTNGMVHPMTNHSGDPVISGNKRIMTLWSHCGEPIET